MTDKTYFANGQLKTLETRDRVAGSMLETHTLSYEGSTGNYLNGHRTKDIFRLVGPDAAAPCRTAACTATYAYDGQGRLVQDYDGHSTTTYYTLDPAGNIVSEQRTGGENRTRTFAYTANQLRSSTDTLAGTRSYFYDREGNLDCVTTSGGPETPGDCGVASGVLASSVLVEMYSYDHLNRLETKRTFQDRVEQDKAVYTYDALDRPVEQTERHGSTAPSTKTLLQYIGLSDKVGVEEQKDNGGTLLNSKRYGYDPYGDLVSLANTPTGQATERLTYSHDAHGSVSLLVNGAGTARASYGYEAYGGTAAAFTKGDMNATTPLNPYRYSAKRLDTGSGTLDMGARRFSPNVGRFLQGDQYVGALSNLGLGVNSLTGNRYALAAGNPISFVEADGHYVLDVDEYGDPTRMEHTSSGLQTPAGGAPRSLADADAVPRDPAPITRGDYRQWKQQLQRGWIRVLRNEILDTSWPTIWQPTVREYHVDGHVPAVNQAAIDATTLVVQDTLDVATARVWHAWAEDLLDDGRSQINRGNFGTKVHAEFAHIVNDELQLHAGGLELRAEVCYRDGRELGVNHRHVDAKCADAVLTANGEPIAVWDVKVGSATLPYRRAEEFWNALPPTDWGVPIIGVHVPNMIPRKP